MNSVDFQLIDDEKINGSFIKRGFIKIYHQSGAMLIMKIQLLNSISVKILFLIKLVLDI